MHFIYYINRSIATKVDYRGMKRIKKNYIMDENDSLSKYIKIPLCHNRTNGAVYTKINFKVEICSAL